MNLFYNLLYILLETSLLVILLFISNTRFKFFFALQVKHIYKIGIVSPFWLILTTKSETDVLTFKKRKYAEETEIRVL